ncbi:CaM, calmodulin [Hyaloscypha sp. PMI_1271]|nr:CaM, calmodulin [Hyaloscypha sp. PMI_1271]
MPGPDLAHAHSTTPEEVQALKDAFLLFDSDSDGVITRNELGAVMKSLGLNPTDAELDDMINEVDIDRTGSVDLDEFIKMMTAETKPANFEEEMRSAFKVFDKDGSGTISGDEIAHVMKSFGENLSDEELKIMMEEVDKDGNGTIDYEEFVNFFLAK